MKARVKETGEIVEVEYLFDDGTALSMANVLKGMSKYQNWTSLAILKIKKNGSKSAYGRP